MIIIFLQVLEVPNASWMKKYIFLFSWPSDWSVVNSYYIIMNSLSRCLLKNPINILIFLHPIMSWIHNHHPRHSSRSSSSSSPIINLSNLIIYYYLLPLKKGMKQLLHEPEWNEFNPFSTRWSSHSGRIQHRSPSSYITVSWVSINLLLTIIIYYNNSFTYLLTSLLLIIIKLWLFIVSISRLVVSQRPMYQKGLILIRSN